MQESQRLQLIMPPRRSRVDSSCLQATFMTRPRAYEHPIFIQLASCSYRIRLKVARAAADCRHIIAIPRLAAGGLRFGFDSTWPEASGSGSTWPDAVSCCLLEGFSFFRVFVNNEAMMSFQNKSVSLLSLAGDSVCDPPLSLPSPGPRPPPRPRPQPLPPRAADAGAPPGPRPLPLPALPRPRRRRRGGRSTLRRARIGAACSFALSSSSCVRCQSSGSSFVTSLLCEAHSDRRLHA